MRELRLLPITEWYNLGLQLKVRQEDLERIQSRYPQDEKLCRIKMFGVWKREAESPSYEKLLQALVAIGRKDLVDTICNNKGLSTDNMTKTKSQNPYCEDTCAQIVSVAKHATSVIYIDDIPKLMTILCKYSYKWSEIGNALGFTTPELCCIRSKPLLLHNAPNSFLEELLNQWLHWPNDEHNMFPTIDTLETALQSSLVGLGTLSATLRNQLLQLGKGFPLALNHDNNPVVRSIPECIKKYTDFMKSKYRCALPLMPPGEWPPNRGRVYSDLTVVEKILKDPLPDQESVKETSKAMSHGQVTVSENERVIKSLDNVFIQDSTIPIKVLVEGVPGVGKSTLVRKSCKDWADGKSLQQFDMVVLVTLREEKSRLAKSIDDLLEADDPELNEQVAKHLQKTSGQHVLFIFDGYDELSDVDKHFFTKIIKGKVLHMSSIVLVSRSYAIQSFKYEEWIHCHVEILGFTEQQMKNYFAQNIKNKCEVATLAQSLKDQASLSTISYTPLNCSILLYVFQQGRRFNLGNTLSELYEAFTLSLINHHLSKLGFYSKLKHLPNSLNCLPQPTICNQFSALCKLAYNGLTEARFRFSLQDITEALNHQELTYEGDIEANLLSLMTSITSFSLFGKKTCYQFLHATVQEFLAARWIAGQPIHEQKRFLTEKWFLPKTRFGLVFYAGITKLSGEVTKEVVQCAYFYFRSNTIIQYKIDSVMERPTKSLTTTVTLSTNSSDPRYEQRINISCEPQMDPYKERISSCQSKSKLHTLSDQYEKSTALLTHLARPYSEPITSLVPLTHSARPHSESKASPVPLTHSEPSPVPVTHSAPLYSGPSSVESVPITNFAPYFKPSILQSQNYCEARHIMKIPAGTEAFLNLVSMLYEAQKDSMQTEIYQRKSMYKTVSMCGVSIGYCQLTGFECSAIASFLSQCPHPLESIKFNFCTLTKRSVEIFLKISTARNCNLTKCNIFHLNYCASSFSSALSLLPQIPWFTHTKELHLHGLHYPRGHTPDQFQLHSVLNMKNMKILCVTVEKIPKEHLYDYEAVFLKFLKVLHTKSSLQKFSYNQSPSAATCESFVQLMSALTDNTNVSLKIGSADVITKELATIPKWICLKICPEGLASAIQLSNARGIEKLHVNQLSAHSLVEPNTMFTSYTTNLSTNHESIHSRPLAVLTTELPSETITKHSKTLQLLDISECEVTDKVAQSIAAALANNRTPRKIRLKASNLTSMGLGYIFNLMSHAKKAVDSMIADIECKVEVIPNGLSSEVVTTLSTSSISAIECSLKTSQSVVLFNSHIDRTLATIKIIVEALLEMENSLHMKNTNNKLIGGKLRRIELSLSKLNDMVAAHIATGLSKNHFLKILNLSCNNITNTGAVNIFKALENNTSLEEVDLSNNNLQTSPQMTRAGAPLDCILKKVLTCNHSLRKVDIAACRLDDIVAAHIGSGLAENRSMKILNLSRNNVTDTGAVEIFKSLQNNTSLEEINLSHNNFHPSSFTNNACESLGCVASQMLTVNSTLRRLELSHCKLCDLDVVKIAAGVSENHSLQMLNLSWNSITISGSMDIIKSLEKNSSLEELNLAWNAINISSDFFQPECSETSLSSEEDKTQIQKFIATIKKIAAINPTMRRIDLRCSSLNPFTGFAFQSVALVVSTKK